MRRIAVATAYVGLALASANATEFDPKEYIPPKISACAPDFVHRRARTTDLVCVTPEAHNRTAQENKDAPTHVDPKGAYGPTSCESGYVWRAAFDGDGVCVTPAVRELVREENRLGTERTLAFHTNAAAVPKGPWLCGEETTDTVARTRTGNVIDRQGRVWRYGLNGRGSATPTYRWQVKDSAVATAEELTKRYAAATTTGKSIAVEDVTAHLPLIEEASKSEAIATDQHDAMTSGSSRLYCLIEDKASGGYREVVLEQRGALVRINPSPAASKLKTWFQPSFWIID